GLDRLGLLPLRIVHGSSPPARMRRTDLEVAREPLYPWDRCGEMERVRGPGRPGSARASPSRGNSAPLRCGIGLRAWTRRVSSYTLSAIARGERPDDAEAQELASLEGTDPVPVRGAGPLGGVAERTTTEQPPGRCPEIVGDDGLGPARVPGGVLLGPARVGGEGDVGMGAGRPVVAPLPDVPQRVEDAELVGQELPRWMGAIPRVQPGPGVVGQELRRVTIGPRGLGPGAAEELPLGFGGEAEARPLEGVRIEDHAGPDLLGVAPLTRLEPQLLAQPIAVAHGREPRHLAGGAVGFIAEAGVLIVARVVGAELRDRHLL